MKVIDRLEMLLPSIFERDWEAKVLRAFPDSYWYDPLRPGGVQTAYGYVISEELWRERMRERRWPTANHSFRYTNNDRKVHRVSDMVIVQENVRCGRCGEDRQIHAPISEANRTGWCVR